MPKSEWYKIIWNYEWFKRFATENFVIMMKFNVVCLIAPATMCLSLVQKFFISFDSNRISWFSNYTKYLCILFSIRCHETCEVTKSRYHSFLPNECIQYNQNENKISFFIYIFTAINNNFIGGRLTNFLFVHNGFTSCFPSDVRTRYFVYRWYVLA